MRIKIKSVNDRVTLAGILVKNGYIVKQIREQRPGGKSYDYGISVTKPKEMIVSTSREED